jgi:nucleotide-binding universal stress UspA family protein
MIVCGTDLGPSGEHAARWAAALARATGQPLRLVHVDDADHQSLDAFPESVREAAAAFHERLDARRASHEDQLKHLADALGLEVERKVLSGRPWEQLVADAEDSHASLLVVGPHVSGLGTTSRRVASHAPCPVLVAGDSEPPDFAKLPWVVGLAHDDRVPALLRDIGALAAQTDSAVVATRVLPALPELEGEAGEEADALLQATSAATHEELRHLSHDLEVPIEPHVVSGAPAAELLIEAKKRGGGVAVAAHSGSRPRDTLRRFFLGSVTERVIRHAEGTPVFVSPALEGD